MNAVSGRFARTLNRISRVDDSGLLGRERANRLTETDLATRFPRRGNQLAQRSQHHFEIVIVAGHSMLERIKLRCQLSVSAADVAEADECTDDENAHAHGTSAIEQRRCHQGTMFGEGPGLGRREFQIPKVVTICDHLIALRRGELEPEIRRKPASVAFDRLIQGLRCDSVENGQINIKDDTVPAHDQNSFVDREGSTRLRRLRFFTFQACARGVD